ncbi:hypothetical protein ACFL3G_09950 [Planctomycetota bacterium]
MKTKLFIIVMLMLLTLVLPGVTMAGGNCPCHYVNGDSGCCDDFGCREDEDDPGVIWEDFTGCRGNKRECGIDWVDWPMLGCYYSDTACIFFDAYLDANCTEFIGSGYEGRPEGFGDFC